MSRKQYAAEFIGTFALVFCGTGAIVINDLHQGVIGHLGVAFTFGAIVMAMIYTFGDISGAHINPAVTLGFWLAGKFKGKSVLPYTLSQAAGALSASLCLRLLFPAHQNLGMTLPAGPLWQSFFLEIILSYILMLVIIHVASGSKETGTMAGIAIGSVVMLEAAFAGPVSGASMNPARSLAPALIAGNLEYQWIYLLAPVVGMALSIVAWKLMNSKRTQ